MDTILEEWAISMADAYRRSSNRENACALVLHQYPGIPADIRHAMWEAIAAFIDNIEKG